MHDKSQTALLSSYTLVTACQRGTFLCLSCTESWYEISGGAAASVAVDFVPYVCFWSLSIDTWLPYTYVLNFSQAKAIARSSLGISRFGTRQSTLSIGNQLPLLHQILRSVALDCNLTLQIITGGRRACVSFSLLEGQLMVWQPIPPSLRSVSVPWYLSAIPGLFFLSCTFFLFNVKLFCWCLSRSFPRWSCAISRLLHCFPQTRRRGNCPRSLPLQTTFP